MIALAVAAALAFCAALALPRLVAGPTLHDRALAARSLLLRAALAIGALAAAWREPFWLDAALALALACFVLHAATLKYFRARSFQPPLASAEERR